MSSSTSNFAFGVLQSVKKSAGVYLFLLRARGPSFLGMNDCIKGPITPCYPQLKDKYKMFVCIYFEINCKQCCFVFEISCKLPTNLPNSINCLHHFKNNDVSSSNMRIILGQLIWSFAVKWQKIIQKLRQDPWNVISTENKFFLGSFPLQPAINCQRPGKISFFAESHFVLSFFMKKLQMRWPISFRNIQKLYSCFVIALSYKCT